MDEKIDDIRESRENLRDDEGGVRSSNLNDFNIGVCFPWQVFANKSDILCWICHCNLLQTASVFVGKVKLKSTSQVENLSLC